MATILDPDAPPHAEAPQSVPVPESIRAVVIRLSSLDSFELSVDRAAVEVAPGAQRLLALLAVQERPVLRDHVATCLWMEKDRDYLRGACGLRLPGLTFVNFPAAHLQLNPGVSVDLRDAIDAARRLMNPNGEAVDGIHTEFLCPVRSLPAGMSTWS